MRSVSFSCLVIVLMTQPMLRTTRSQSSWMGRRHKTRIYTSLSYLSLCIELTLRICKLRPIDNSYY
ncbi:BgTH12-04412 [Blumeria graminis f. sp. triticale]|uniref:BgTH12-04412 n=1 Tax=Blumeria graminis f. sp. triticale TaxID=1689686 RepID=A0A9W4CUN5_BLUGR|nr:BgTH12-04412 [Blumeria graminis f. sp. triticale]